MWGVLVGRAEIGVGVEPEAVEAEGADSAPDKTEHPSDMR